MGHVKTCKNTGCKEVFRTGFYWVRLDLLGESSKSKLHEDSLLDVALATGGLCAGLPQLQHGGELTPGKENPGKNHAPTMFTRLVRQLHDPPPR